MMCPCMLVGEFNFSLMNLQNIAVHWSPRGSWRKTFSVRTPDTFWCATSSLHTLRLSNQTGTLPLRHIMSGTYMYSQCRVTSHINSDNMDWAPRKSITFQKSVFFVPSSAELWFVKWHWRDTPLVMGWLKYTGIIRSKKTAADSTTLQCCPSVDITSKLSISQLPNQFLHTKKYFSIIQ